MSSGSVKSGLAAVDADLSMLFNLPTVLRTRELMDEIPGSWDAMVESFVSHGRGTLDRPATEVAEARFDAVQRTAHNMKGTAAMIGAVRLSEWSADLEIAAQSRRTALCSRLYVRLCEEFGAVAQALEANAF